MLWHFRVRDLLRLWWRESWVVEFITRWRALRAGLRGDSQALRRDYERRRRRRRRAR